MRGPTTGELHILLQNFVLMMLCSTLALVFKDGEDRRYSNGCQVLHVGGLVQWCSFEELPHPCLFYNESTKLN